MQDALNAAGNPIPQWEAADFLVDTGASVSGICATIASKIGLVSHSVTPIATPSTGNSPVMCKTYDVALFIPGPSRGKGHMEELVTMIESDYSSHSIDGLLGRDVLGSCVLTYIGQQDRFILSY